METPPLPGASMIILALFLSSAFAIRPSDASIADSPPVEVTLEQDGRMLEEVPDGMNLIVTVNIADTIETPAEPPEPPGPPPLPTLSVDPQRHRCMILAIETAMSRCASGMSMGMVVEWRLRVEANGMVVVPPSFDTYSLMGGFADDSWRTCATEQVKKDAPYPSMSVPAEIAGSFAFRPAPKKDKMDCLSPPSAE